MADNPYHSPSYAASLDILTGGLGQRELTRITAARWVANTRSSALILVVAGLCSFTFPIMAFDAVRSLGRQIDPAELAVCLSIPILLLVWGFFQYRLNIVAVTCTGIAATAMIVACIGIAVILTRQTGFVDNWFHWMGPPVILSVFMIWPVSLAIEAWVWRFRGLDPAAIACEYERAQQASPSQNVRGAGDVR